MTSQSTTATELLSPAGDWEAMRAAIANGADAVYFGLSNFNARHRATNFTLAELPDVMQRLHAANVRGYVALNTLIFSDELEEVARTVRAISEAGADAIIVQDLGLAWLASQLAPDLPIHGSTQMTLTEPRGIEFVRQLGVQRVILARELSVTEVQRIAEQTFMPLEVFVHGALCVAYSGQCLTSEALGGRSANRGQCAQACRLPYALVVDGQERDLGEYAYLLSPQDLASTDLVADLVKIGVSCLKIEGRLKSPEYVASTTTNYRSALDAALAGKPFELSRRGQLDLEQSFSRGFSPGFLQGVNHQQLVPGRFPKSRGVRVGLVRGRTRRGLLVALDPRHLQGRQDYDAPGPVLKPGDGVVLDEGHPDQEEQGARLIEVHGLATETAPLVEIVFDARGIQIDKVSLGSIVWKTDDPEFRQRMARSYARIAPVRRTPLSMHLVARVGEPLVMQVRDPLDQRAELTWPGPLQAARRQPLTLDTLRDQLGRLGETPFELGEVTWDVPSEVMVPKSVLNDLRRQAVERFLAFREARIRERRLEPQALARLRAKAAEVPQAANDAGRREQPSPTESRFNVLVRNLQQLADVLDWQPPNGLARPAMVYCDFEDVRRYRVACQQARQSGLSIGLASLRIVKPGEESLLHQVAKTQPDAVLARNLTSISYFRQHAPELPLVGDFSLNVANELTARLLLEAGLCRLVPSYDLTWDQLRAMLGRSIPSRYEVVIHQHMPMFHMEHCVFAATLSEGKDWRDCGRPCDRHQVDLRDRVGAHLPLVADIGCRNTVFNSQAQSGAEYVPRMLAAGLRHFRLDLLREDRSRSHALLDHYARLLAGQVEGRATWRGLQVLNQLGVTRGTLEA